MMFKKTSQSPGDDRARPSRRRGLRPSLRPYTYFERGGTRRFGRASSPYRLFRVHG